MPISYSWLTYFETEKKDKMEQQNTYTIIGGGGFLGQHLVHLLLNQEREANSSLRIKIIDKASKLKLIYPENFSNKQVELYLGVDISENDNLSKIFMGSNTIFHLAAAIAYGRKNKDYLNSTNVKGVKNIIKHAKLAFVKKIVYVSSFATLGCLDQKDKTKKATENCMNNWKKDNFCYYGLSKFCGEQLIMEAHENENHLCTAVAIPGLLLGPGHCCPAGNMPFDIALRKKWSLVPQGGSNYIDVRDVAAGLVALAEHKHISGKYLLVSHNLEHRDLLQKIADLAGRKLWLTEIPKFLHHLIAPVFSFLEWILSKQSPYSKEGVLKAFKYRYFSHQKAANDLGWIPQYSLEDTLLDTMNWLNKKRKHEE